MALLKITEGADPNYLATVVKVPTIKAHPNADKLEIVEIFGNTIVVGKGAYTEGELVVYFPVESAICSKFLSWANLFDKPELNKDQLTKGYFQSKGRVRAVALRGIPSQGFLFKVVELAHLYEISPTHFNVGDTFDTIGSEPLVTKYVKGTEKATNTASKKSRVPKWLDATIGILPRCVRRKCYIAVNSYYNKGNEGIKAQIVDGQFKFHYKTEHLGKNIWLLGPNDQITVSGKLHGTSAIYANILCNRTLGIFDSLRNWFSDDIPTIEYKFVYSSRSILKNRRDEKFTDDVWGTIAAELHAEIPEGFTVYGEIVGYTPTGKTIQKNYDYGCRKDECQLRVYRITEHMGEEGVRELSWDEIDEFCHKKGLQTVPVYYTGLAQELFPDIPLDKDWNTNFLTKLKEVYLDIQCAECTTGVVNEGIVLRIENGATVPAFKFKSPKFLLQETKERDNDESNMEDEN